MLEVCWTHITISDNLDAMGLAGSKPVHAIHQGNHKKQHQQGSKTTANQMQGNCTQTSTNMATELSHIHQDMHPAQPKMRPATSLVKLDIGSQDARRFTKEVTKETT